MKSLLTKKSTLFYIFSSFLLSLLTGLTHISTAQSSFDQGSGNLSFVFGSFGKGAETFGTLVSLGTTIAVSLAFFFFFYNLYKFIKAGDAESKEEAQGKMVWSVVAIIVITSLWGIIGFMRGIFGIGPGEPNDIPIPGTVLRESRVENN